jgi:hypothetical protein
MNIPAERPRGPLDEIDPAGAAFYAEALAALHERSVPFLVGGSYAFAHYTGIVRHTKDFDVFVRRPDSCRALDALAAAGYQTEVTFPHWLGKAFSGEHLVDVIFGSGNGVAVVDDLWFERGIGATVLGVDVRLCPVEEMIWSKAFVMERERFDGADIAHLIKARGDRLEWERLVSRFGEHWRVLLAHLTLFGFIYPGDRGLIPRAVLEDLLARLSAETALGSVPPDEAGRVCLGPLLSREQYLADLEAGCEDPRLKPLGSMTREETERWTDAIGKIP